MKLIIVAKSAELAKKYGVRKFVYCDEPYKLKGSTNAKIVLFGDYWLHPNWDAIRHELTIQKSFKGAVVCQAPVSHVLAGSLDSARSIAKKLDLGSWMWVNECGLIPRDGDVTIGFDLGECKGYLSLLDELDVLGITKPRFVNA